MTRYGYAAINVTLREEDDVRTNRGMRKATFEGRGLEYAGELAEQNCRGLKRVVEWNLDHDIHYYRIASDLLPWFSRYDLDDLPNAEAVRGLLETADRLRVRQVVEIVPAEPWQEVRGNTIVVDVVVEVPLDDALEPATVLLGEFAGVLQSALLESRFPHPTIRPDIVLFAEGDVHRGVAVASHRAVATTGVPVCFLLRFPPFTYHPRAMGGKREK